VIADLLNTKITDLATLESLPIGAVVVDADEDAWQLRQKNLWRSTMQLRSEDPSDELIQFGPLVVVWLPPEVTR
jgi:hypothetical protein